MDQALGEITPPHLPDGRIPDTALVSFGLSPARHGWICLAVQAGTQADVISCSHVYDPFAEITALVEACLAGKPGCVEIDEEGNTTFLRIDVEPGQLLGRLRVYEPGEWGEPEAIHIDASVDVVQLAHAWVSAFRPYVEGYDPRHWTPTFPEEGAVEPRTLAGINLDSIISDLRNMGRLPWHPQHGNDDVLLAHVRRHRGRYARARGVEEAAAP